jgi:hypothetical protein
VTTTNYKIITLSSILFTLFVTVSTTTPAVLAKSDYQAGFAIIVMDIKMREEK